MIYGIKRTHVLWKQRQLFALNYSLLALICDINLKLKDGLPGPKGSLSTSANASSHPCKQGSGESCYEQWSWQEARSVLFVRTWLFWIQQALLYSCCLKSWASRVMLSSPCVKTFGFKKSSVPMAPLLQHFLNVENTWCTKILYSGRIFSTPGTPYLCYSHME